MSLELLFLTKLAAATASLHISSTFHSAQNVFLVFATRAASPLDLALPRAIGQGTLVQRMKSREYGIKA